jgi:DNA-binding MarR family transcriptional regulator
MLAPIKNSAQQFENFSNSIYNPHRWDRVTKKLDAERIRARLRIIVKDNLPPSLLGCMVTLYVMSEEDYRPDGLIDVPMNEFWEKFNVTKMTFSRWIKKLESENLVLVVGSTNKRRICVKWDRLQAVPNL